MNNKKKKIVFGAVIAVLVLFTVGIASYIIVKAVMNGKNDKGKQNEDIASSDVATPSVTEGQSGMMDDESIFYEGREYLYNTDMKNILFIGVDKREFPADGFFDGGQADCIMLICLNGTSKDAEILQISRETMVNYEIYGLDRTVYSTRYGQLCLQYAYGDGRELSCMAVAERVKEVLLETPVDGYITLDLDAVAMINDMVGGVELTMPEDYTWLDPAFEKGKKITLAGSQAERFIRGRDISVTGSNMDRMHRQALYIPALIAKLRAKIGGDKEQIEEYREMLGENMISDLQAEDFSELSEYNLSDGNITIVPGEVKSGEDHDEFYVNFDELKKIIIKMLYKEK